ncbi:hypothetical protein NDU88_001842 [Pleurodeles waltl]|uniref:Uncharacterized protein n=1 Tax=Pleurodeles waltl TaxID=8319 RepID=A0AAV7Q4B2_PLEWA|nr:hypothetical protein NDU88_001842 [Pleurodeles waltl]
MTNVVGAVKVLFPPPVSIEFSTDHRVDNGLSPITIKAYNGVQSPSFKIERTVSVNINQTPFDAEAGISIDSNQAQFDVEARVSVDVNQAPFNVEARVSVDCNQEPFNIEAASSVSTNQALLNFVTSLCQWPLSFHQR